MMATTEAAHGPVPLSVRSTGVAGGDANTLAASQDAPALAGGHPERLHDLIRNG
jgi:hypothetical protein